MVNHFTRASGFESGNRLTGFDKLFSGCHIGRQTDLLRIVDKLQTLHRRDQSALADGVNRQIVIVWIFKNVFPCHMNLVFLDSIQNLEKE